MSFVDSQSPTVNKKNRETFGGKYIDAFMSLRGYKGKKIKRVLHSVNSFNSQAFNNLIDFFGLSYVLDTSTDEELREDIVIENMLVVDRINELYLTGMELDYTYDDFESAFVFNNPKATSSCGCGTSFSV